MQNPGGGFEEIGAETLLSDRYQLIRVLGHGGMGTVYEAFDRTLRRSVAVKVVRPELCDDHRVLARFRREARAAAKLSHPGIVSLYDADAAGESRPYIVMELVEGWTLDQVLRSHGPFSPERAIEVGREIADALNYMHAAGIVHRDIKPGNVMVSGDGRVKLLDMGIARMLDATPVTTGRSMHGTAEYVAPEQVRGQAADRRADIYSLGIMMFEMIAGGPPFTGDNPITIAYKHLEARAPDVRTIRPDAPEGLARVIATCLAKNPDDRYPYASDLGHALGSAHTRSWPESAATDELRRTRDTKPLPRRGRKIALVTALVLMLAGGAAMLAGPAFTRQVRAIPHAGRPLPLPPGDLRVATSCAGSLDAQASLEWSPPPTGADGYEVQRATAFYGPFETVATIDDGSATWFRDDGAALATRYHYKVLSRLGEMESVASPAVKAGTPMMCLW